MKKLTISGLVIAVVVLCILLFWRHTKLAQDRELQSRLTGTWTFEFMDMLWVTNAVASDGSFAMQEATGTNLFHITGTWRIKGGDLHETVTSNTAKIGLRLPHTEIHRIVRLDTNELAAFWYTTNIATWKKTKN